MLTKKTKNLHGVTKLHRDYDSSNSLVFILIKVDKNNGYIFNTWQSSI